MATTVSPNQPRTRSSLRASGRASARGRAVQAVPAVRASRDAEYDLLTAALIGATVGAGLTYLLRRGPSGRRPVSPMVLGLGRGAAWAGRHAGHASVVGARWMRDQGEEAWDRLPRRKIQRELRHYAGRAREAMDDVVESELRDLRRAIRRQRKRLGV